VAFQLQLCSEVSAEAQMLLHSHGQTERDRETERERRKIREKKRRKERNSTKISPYFVLIT
jgi:hypothetical protein